MYGFHLICIQVTQFERPLEILQLSWGDFRSFAEFLLEVKAVPLLSLLGDFSVILLFQLLEFEGSLKILLGLGFQRLFFLGKLLFIFGHFFLQPIMFLLDVGSQSVHLRGKR